MIFAAAFLLALVSSNLCDNFDNVTIVGKTCDNTQYLFQTNNATNNHTVDSCSVPSGNLGVASPNKTISSSILSCAGARSGFLVNCSGQGVLNSYK